MLKIYTHTPSARFAYISKFLLETVLGIDFKHISHLSEFDPAQDQLLNYSNQRSSYNELYLAPHGLLSETDIRDLNIEVKNDQALPYFFLFFKQKTAYDIFSAAFYLLSRYEEYLPNQADAHGRFAAENSLAHRAGFLQQPLIDEWAFAFASELKKVFPTLAFRENHFQVACTIDIDQAFRTKGKSNARFIKSILGSLLNADFKDLKNKIAVRRLQIDDPFDQYERLEKMHRKINWKAIYFILFAEKNTAQDINLAITQADFLQRIKRLSHTADIGIHPSYQSNKNPEIMQSERFNLSQVIQKNINSSRQHYLKMQIPNTYYDLIKIGLWNEGIKNKLIMENGSVQNIPEIPTEMKEVYKTVWEMSQKRILQMAANRSVFIDQSQSLNLFVDNATKPKLLAAHLFGWKLGLKTGMYYLRTKAAVDAIKFTLNNDKKAEPTKDIEPVAVEVYSPNESGEMTAEDFKAMVERARAAGPDDCEMCGS